MFRTMAARAVAMTLFVLVAVMAGCGGGKGRDEKMTMFGVYISPPAGWHLDEHKRYMCSKGDCQGSFNYEFHQKRGIAEYVKAQVAGNNGIIVSGAPRTIGECEAYEAVIEYPQKGAKALTVYIRHRGVFVRISFVTPAEAFPDEEPAIRATLKSIEFESPGASGGQKDWLDSYRPFGK